MVGLFLYVGEKLSTYGLPLSVTFVRLITPRSMCTSSGTKAKRGTTRFPFGPDSFLKFMQFFRNFALF